MVRIVEEHASVDALMGSVVYWPQKDDGGAYRGRIGGSPKVHENTYYVGMAGDIEVWGFTHDNDVPKYDFNQGDRPLCLVVAEKGGAGLLKRHYNWTILVVDHDGVIRSTDNDVDVHMNRLVELYALCASHDMLPALPSPVTR